MTHQGVDGRLWCKVGGSDHHWDSWCKHKRDPDTHPHHCCRHWALKSQKEYDKFIDSIEGKWSDA